MQQVKQVIKVGGPWESLVLQDILQEASVQQADGMLFTSKSPFLYVFCHRCLQGFFVSWSPWLQNVIGCCMSSFKIN
jgi:glycerol-3-phosphate O-acyltransferase